MVSNLSRNRPSDLSTKSESSHQSFWLAWIDKARRGAMTGKNCALAQGRRLARRDARRTHSV
jgi:hypothetical protein